MKRQFIQALVLLSAFFWVVPSLVHAKRLHGKVHAKGEYGPCEVVKVIKPHLKATCDSVDKVKKQVVIVVGDEPCYSEGVTTVIKFKGKERVKTMGRIRATGHVLAPRSLYKDVGGATEIILWQGKKSNDYMIIQPERAVFKKVRSGDGVILKVKSKKVVVEGC